MTSIVYVHEVVKGLDLKPVVDACREDGGRLYGPSPTLKGWLYAHGLR